MLFFIGDSCVTKCGNVKVMQYTNRQHIVVKFEDGTTVNTNYVSLSKGCVSNPNLVPDVEIKHNISKHIWLRLIKFVRQGTATIDDDWLDYNKFDAYYCSMIGYEYGWEFTNRLLVLNCNHYGVDTCILLPSQINRNLIVKEKIGVRKVRNLYSAVCKSQDHSEISSGHKSYEEAFLVYRKLKELEIQRLANKYKNLLDKRAYVALQNYTIITR